MTREEDLSDVTIDVTLDMISVLAALEARGMKMVRVEREFICRKCCLRIDSNVTPEEPYF